MANATQAYTVRFVHHQPDGRFTEDQRIVTATSPDEAMTMVERMGLDYHEAEVSDAYGDQVAVYGSNMWREDWD